jgi:hypothetical protein
LYDFGNKVALDDELFLFVFRTLVSEIACTVSCVLKVVSLVQSYFCLSLFAYRTAVIGLGFQESEFYGLLPENDAAVCCSVAIFWVKFIFCQDLQRHFCVLPLPYIILCGLRTLHT